MFGDLVIGSDHTGLDASRSHRGVIIATVDRTLAPSLFGSNPSNVSCCLLTRNGEKKKRKRRKQRLLVGHGAAPGLRCRVLKRRRLIRVMEPQWTVTMETASTVSPQNAG